MSLPSGSVVEVWIAPDPPARLDKALARDVPEGAHLSRTRIARLIGEGRVERDGEVITDLTHRPVPGERWLIHVPEAAPTSIEPEPIALDILYEDEDIIVVNKPAGMVVHPAPGSPSATLVNALLAHCGPGILHVGGVERPGIVHRIDKDTSGVLVVAKTDRAHAGLAEQFARHSVHRHYSAVVHGVPDAGDARLRGLRGVDFEPGNVLVIRTGIERSRHDRQRMAVTFHGGRRAVTRARVIEAFGRPGVASLVDCWLETGRTHQIRVHMAYAGHGLVGDPVYGSRRKVPKGALSEAARQALLDFPRQALHARTLGFRHPATGQEMRFEAPLPADMAELVAVLRGDGQGGVS
ncbi:MAG: RluA family pseudouridine synthase [Alphaproteobacteria bacterium]|nr:MAG: RluA family pseudouridine synthase [Alphaproteobacteria bacterium]